LEKQQERNKSYMTSTDFTEDGIHKIRNVLMLLHFESVFTETEMAHRLNAIDLSVLKWQSQGRPPGWVVRQLDAIHDQLSALLPASPDASAQHL
jgi:hypothetical protein